jgi:anion-transporting  ArsA/GET3 family ATPase
VRTGFWESLPPLVIVTGKGGVGKTMVSCALARAAVGAGLRVLLLELDARESLHRFMGCSPSGGGVIDVAPGLRAENVRPRAVVDRLIEERVRPAWVARRMMRSVIYEQFVQGAPGLREVSALGYAIRAADRGKLRRAGRVVGAEYDLVLLDAPATGHGVSLLLAPKLLAEAIGGGPIAALAREVSESIGDPGASALWAVSTAEGMALRETLELDEALRGGLDRGLDLLAVNRLIPTAAPEGDPGSKAKAEPASGEAWEAIWQERAAAQRRQLAGLAESWKGPLIELPLSGHEGPEAVAELAGALERS